MAFTYGDLDTLNEIRRKVMQGFHYVTDMEKWRVEDYWEGDMKTPGIPHALNGDFDCEEAAIQFMLFAMKAGYNARLVQMVRGGDTGHLVCEVTTKSYDDSRILDMSRSSAVRRDQYSSDWAFVRTSPWNPKPRDQRPWEWVDLSNQRP